MSDFTIVDAAGNPVSYGRSASRPGSAVGRPAPNFARSSPLAGGASISGPVARLVGCGPRQVRPCTGRAGCMCDECNASRNSLDL